VPSSSRQASLLGGSHPIRDGNRVRLRLARGSDARAIGDLLGTGSRVAVRRLVHFDPRRCCVVCASALIDGHETLVGIGWVAIGRPGVEPEVVLADEELRAVRELLADALNSRAAAASRPQAA
jgi:hypothetical protein